MNSRNTETYNAFVQLMQSIGGLIGSIVMVAFQISLVSLIVWLLWNSVVVKHAPIMPVLSYLDTAGFVVLLRTIVTIPSTTAGLQVNTKNKM